MNLELTLLTGSFYVELPNDWAGWVGWLSILAAALYFAYRAGWESRSLSAKKRLLLSGLVLLVPLTSLFLVLRLPVGTALLPPGKPIDPLGAGIVVFSALPWMLGAVLLGPYASAGLAVFSGIILAFAETHSIFTPVETLLVALIFNSFLWQRYRTPLYRMLRHPLVSALLLALIYPVVFLISMLFLSQGGAAERLDYAISNLLTASLAFGAQLVIGGLFAEVISLFAPLTGHKQAPLLPSPSERSLEMRFYYSITPIAAAALVLLVIGDWRVAENASRQMLQERMGSTAKVSSETIPYYLEAGQNLIMQLSREPRLQSEDREKLPLLLADQLRTVPFFHQLYLVDGAGRVLAGFPAESYDVSSTFTEEKKGIQLALQGVAIQYYTLPPAAGSPSAQVSFLAAVLDDGGAARGVLVGRSSLSANPLTQPVLLGLAEVAGEDGEGMLLDGSGRIIYHTGGMRQMEVFSGSLGDQASFYDNTAPDGTRRLVYYQPTAGHPWSVVLSVPAKRAQQMALNIAIPLLAMVGLLIAASVGMLRFGFRSVTSSLYHLSHQANLISQGQLGNALSTEGEDEVGRLRRSFEQMRVSLKARMDELNRLLVVSQGVASSLDFEDAVKPILEAVDAIGGSAARIILVPSTAPGMDSGEAPACYGHGPMSDIYSMLDDQVLNLTRQQDQVLLTNLSRVRMLNHAGGHPTPNALAAVALRHENNFFGVLWIGFDKPHHFTEDEIRYLATLAGQAALAAANARLFQTAEVGRQRLAAILASTPDPILVTDRQNCLLLSNPAARQVLGLSSDSRDGQQLQSITSESGLLNLLSLDAEDRQSAEVRLPDGKVYLATASTVEAEGQRMGRVCLLRDITHLKELDALKSDFVSTVSHDLRSPLLHMSGFATMLEMVGDLNDQQKGYVSRIVLAVESMSRLVSNLLDLGRIEAGVDLQLETVSVQDVVEKAARSVQPQSLQKRIALDVWIDPDSSPLIEADQALLEQAVQNLVENAIKYTGDGGKVKVSVKPAKDGLVFEVTDTGIGIAPVDQPRLFEKFFRVSHREARKEHGTGLGLAIVKSIAERHRGRVWVESQLGKGSTFSIWLPLRQFRRER
jgi:PAS domain S-box-containing protein